MYVVTWMMIIMYVCHIDKPVVNITAVTLGCGYVNISVNTTNNNNDECTVRFYNFSVSYVTRSDRVTVSRITRVTTITYTITGLPNDT